MDQMFEFFTNSFFPIPCNIIWERKKPSPRFIFHGIIRHMKSCLTPISEKYDALSYSERLFADFIIKNREDAVQMSIAELGSRLGIAQSTIVATTKKLGFAGWKEFRISLAAELVNPINTWEQKQAEQQELKTCQQVISSNISFLQEISRTIKAEEFEKVVERMICAKRIALLGIGTSNVLAQEAFDSFFRLGLPVEVFCDWHHQQLCASRLDKDCIAIFFSQSGVNKDIIFLADRAKECGCTMIGISNFRNTPFSKFMDILLAPLSAPSSYHDNHFALRIPILGIIEILYYMIAEHMGSKYQKELALNFKIAKSSAV